jgi:quercetin dioxygenase-like cupin family protein
VAQLSSGPDNPDPVPPTAAVRQDWTRAATPWPFLGHSDGFDRLAILDPTVGTTHTDLGVGRLMPGGVVPAHVHSYEEAIYVLSGELSVQIEHRAYLLRSGDFAFFPVGSAHAMANTSTTEARWMDVNSPVSLRRSSGRADTFFPTGFADVLRDAEPPDLADPTLRLVGHYDGTEPEHVRQSVSSPARGRASAGMNTALLAYSGISVKMLVDQNRGAHLLTMFMVDYEVNGAAQVHDHPFEEAYFFLKGETDFELGGTTHHFQAGDVAWAGVGATHACFNTDGGRVRWIETQAPAPPQQHSYRWPADWAHYETSHH